MIICDTRERKWKHIESYFWTHNIPYKVKKLDVGDYMSTHNPHIVIDRKANLDEVCMNLSSGKGNYHRFLGEIKRARQQGIKLILLVEGTSCNSIHDVKHWKSKYTNYTGQWLFRQMKQVTYAYGIEWRFCRTSQTAKEILRILECEETERGNYG